MGRRRHRLVERRVEHRHLREVGEELAGDRDALALLLLAVVFLVILVIAGMSLGDYTST